MATPAATIKHELRRPASQDELRETVLQAVQAKTPIYPAGGDTAQRHGMAISRSGVRLDMAGLSRVVDYPDRDMTITVEAGMTIAELQRSLARHGQRIPVDVPQADRATVGGVVARASSGPRRYGYGTIRDYVIGITAVDGHGTLFHGGGRVVKNVAGYDFCKLLVGSLGTLAVITQVTFKVRPLAEASAFVTCEIPSFSRGEEILAALVSSEATPAAIEVLFGPIWKDDALLGSQDPKGVGRIVVGLEGTRSEVAYMVEQLSEEWHQLGVAHLQTIPPDMADRVWERLTVFSSMEIESPVALMFHVLPRHVGDLCEKIAAADSKASVLAHAGNGTVLARMDGATPDKMLHLLVQEMLPAAVAAGGTVQVYSCPVPQDFTRSVMWGAPPNDVRCQLAVKEKFDPHNLLNPGRYWFA